MKKQGNRSSSLSQFADLLNADDKQNLEAAYNKKPVSGTENSSTPAQSTLTDKEEIPVANIEKETESVKDETVSAPVVESKEQIKEVVSEIKPIEPEVKDFPPVVFSVDERPTLHVPNEKSEEIPEAKIPTKEIVPAAGKISKTDQKEVKKYVTIRIEQKYSRALMILAESGAYEGITDKTAMLEYMMQYFLDRKKTQEILEQGIKF